MIIVMILSYSSSFKQYGERSIAISMKTILIRKTPLGLVNLQNLYHMELGFILAVSYKLSILLRYESSFY